MNKPVGTRAVFAKPSPPPRVGLFGKVPARADFITRGLSPAFADPWHAWLVRGLAAAREALGAHYEPAYMAAPVWRFLLPPGACGPEAAAGVLLPSVDAAGRLFPLTLVTVAARLDASTLRRAEEWFGTLEDAGREALDDAMEFEPWLARVAALPAPSGATGLEKLLSGEDSVMFWSDGSPYVASAALAMPALPDGAGFVRLLADPGCVAEGVS